VSTRPANPGLPLAVIGFSIAVIGLALALVVTMEAFRRERERAVRAEAALETLRRDARLRIPIAAIRADTLVEAAGRR
jgi:hypothetical protein